MTTETKDRQKPAREMSAALAAAFGFDSQRLALRVKGEPGLLHFDVLDVDDDGKPQVGQVSETEDGMAVFDFITHRESYRVERV